MAVIIVLILIALLSSLLWRQSRNRKHLNEQLQKLDLTRKRFLVNIAHELRTPVTLINAPLQDAIEKLNSGKLDVAKKNLDKVYNSSKKLTQLTEEVLDISKLDEQTLKFEGTSQDLNAFLNRVFYAFESLANRKGVVWKNSISIVKCFYETDFNKLEKIINNLLSNALKHTKQGELIEFHAVVEHEKLLLTVADTGKGIPKTELAHIFERYYQVNKSDKTLGGLGIGLSLVKELTDFLKGEISAESDLGKGSSFKVIIPIKTAIQPISLVVPDEELKTDTSARALIDISNDDLPHLLVVEDNFEMADFIQQLLSETYRVTLADNGKSALERLKVSSFDLITADVMMPEMDGLEFIRQIKSHSDWKNIPVVMITALSDEVDRVQGLRLGIDDYITKPFSPKELLARVNNLLENAQTRFQTTLHKEEKIVGTEEQVLKLAREHVEAHLNDNNYTVKDLASELNLSERQANRVLKKLVGLSCLQFIREVRLLKAYRLLEARKYATVAEVAFAVGFENTSYFTRLFSNRFGKKPSEMVL